MENYCKSNEKIQNSEPHNSWVSYISDPERMDKMANCSFLSKEHKSCGVDMQLEYKTATADAF